MTADVNGKSHASKPEEDILDLVKGNGPWQYLIFLMSFTCTIPLATHNLVMSFFAPNLDHWCARPPDVNITVEEWKTIAIPPSDKFCSRYKYVNYSNLLSNVSYTDREIISCDAWEYDNSIYVSTVLSKWDLVCEHEWLVSMSKSIFTGGYLLAVLVCGYIADRFGRKPVIVVCNVIALLSAVICAFSTSFLMFAILRFFIAVGTAGSFNTIFVLLMEVVGPSYRSAYGVLINLGWCLGFVTLPLIAWLLKDWFWVQLFITIPCAFLLLTWCFVPESPRWLLSQGNFEEAEDILINAAKRNGAQLTDIDRKLKEMVLNKSKKSESENQNGNFFDLLRTPGLWQKTLNLFYLWAVISFMYYGLSYNTNELAGDPFINFAISGAVELPANLLTTVVIKSHGRRNPLSGALMIGAVACLLMYPLPPDPWWIGTIVSMIGKFFITCSFSIIYVYTAEIFPTVTRNIGMGSASLCGRVGSILAPFVRELGNSTHPVVPQIVYGALAATGSILVLFLPETHNCSIPDTIGEAAKVTRNKTPTKTSNDMMMKEFA